ncbi:MAG: CsbD family protein [Hyphomonadaceae bacterium]
MDKDRVDGAAKQAEGKLKEAAGKIVGDKKLEAEGAAKNLEGKIQNAAGGVKDAIRQNDKPRQ